jgi:hypothetical protein
MEACNKFKEKGTKCERFINEQENATKGTLDI